MNSSRIIVIAGIEVDISNAFITKLKGIFPIISFTSLHAATKSLFTTHPRNQVNKIAHFFYFKQLLFININCVLRFNLMNNF